MEESLTKRGWPDSPNLEPAEVAEFLVGSSGLLPLKCFERRGTGAPLLARGVACGGRAQRDSSAALAAQMARLMRTATETYDLRQRSLQLVLLIGKAYRMRRLDIVQRLMFMLLHALHGLSLPTRSWIRPCARQPWSIDKYTDSECWEQLRFRKPDILTLAEALRLPTELVTARRRYRFTREEALCVLLRRLAHAGSWETILDFLGGRSRSEYVEVYRAMLIYIWTHFSDKISNICRWADHAQLWADAIHVGAGAPCARCVGFVDGTIRSIARPGVFACLTTLMNSPLSHFMPFGLSGVCQDRFYSGYVKEHGIKFQSVVAPNGLIVDLWGPMDGRRGDGYMLRESRLESRLQQFCAITGSDYYVYGDPAYPLTPYIMRGLKGPMTAIEAAFCQAMSRERITVEWGYHLITEKWRMLDCVAQQKVRKSPIAINYAVAALLTNVHSCFYGNEISLHYMRVYGERLKPPSVEDYLHCN